MSLFQITALPHFSNAFISSGFGAEQLAHQLSSHTPVPIPYHAPINWAAWITFGSSLLALALTIRFFAPILRSRWTWAIFTVLVVLIMTSGYMFTQIRGMPMTAANGQWIASGFQSQYGQEVYAVSALCEFGTTLLVLSWATLKL